MAMGTTRCSSCGLCSDRPSIAPSTEIAGVMMPSPNRSPAPNSASKMAMDSLVRWPASPSTSAPIARMPPSPLLSARSTNHRYFTTTTEISDQNTSDITPSTAGSVGATAWATWGYARHSFTA